MPIYIIRSWARMLVYIFLMVAYRFL